ncbi:MAG TPA: HAMP domain-containing sensor histidine kinase [Polyangiaceae bacterium]|jgi:signal transduction histidine kinase
MKIAWKFTGTLLACIVAALSINAYVSVAAQSRRYERLISSHESVTAKSLRPAIVQLWLTDGPARALKAVEDANSGVPEVDIRWVSLASNSPPSQRPMLALDRLRAVAAGEDVMITDRDFNGGAGRIFQYVALRVPDQPAAALEVSETLKLERDLHRVAWGQAIQAAVGLALAAAATTSMLGVWFVGRPMRRLLAQVERVGAGDLASRVNVPQDDELGDLAAALNTMSQRLLAAQEREDRAVKDQLRILDQLRHADRLATIGRLAAGMAHELGTPLNVVDARAKAISTGRFDGEGARDAARAISAQVERMTYLMRQLLDFARRREPHRVETDLSALVQRTIAFLGPVASKRGVALAFEGGDDGQRAKVDATQVEQVVTNLVMNAVQASASGATVSVRSFHQSSKPPLDDGRAALDCACVEVADHGTGIASEDLVRIFEPFFTTKPVGEGTGLGLSVSYGIVKDHRGWMTVETEAGKGSRFVVHLPLEPS